MRIFTPTIEDLVTKVEDLATLVDAYLAEFEDMNVKISCLITMLADHTSNPNACVWLLQDDANQIVGLITGTCNIEPLTGEHVAVQTALMTHRYCRGYTLALIRQLEEWGQKQNCKRIYIHTGPDTGRYKRREIALAHSGYLPALRCYGKEL